MAVMMIKMLHGNVPLNGLERCLFIVIHLVPKTTTTYR
jgi:hypothetical protein